MHKTVEETYLPGAMGEFFELFLPGLAIAKKIKKMLFSFDLALFLAYIYLPLKSR